MASPNRLNWSSETFEQVTDLLAEALFQDFQRHVRATVNSPQGINNQNGIDETRRGD